MKIGPTEPEGAIRQNCRAAKADSQVVNGKAERRGGIEITEDARRRLSQAAAKAREELLRPGGDESQRASRDLAGSERIAELKRRVDEGYYEQPKIRQQIADHLADDV